MSLYLPSYKSGFARCAAESKAPGLWKDCVGLWAPSLGATGLTLRDWSGFQNHGTLTNGPTWGVFGGRRALGFDEVNDHVLIPDAPQLDMADASWSFWLWYYLDDNSGSDYQYVLSRGDLGDTPYFNVYMKEGTGEWEVGLKDDDGTTTLLTSVSAPGGDAIWHLLGVQRDKAASEIQIWLDGVKDASQADTDLNGFNRSDGLYIGARADLNANRLFGGQIGSLAKYARALLPSEIQQPYAEPDVMITPRPTQVAVSGGAPPVTVAPTSHLYGPLVGPLGGAI